MKKVFVAVPFTADDVRYEANKEYDLEDDVIERALKINPNMLTVLGCGDEVTKLTASLEAETNARIEAEAKVKAEAEARTKAEEELTEVKKELAKVKKELAKAKKE